MEKALEILKFFQIRELVHEDTQFESIFYAQAIIEIEKYMQPKTCDGCVYGMFGVDSFGLEIECTLVYRCSRGQDDMFKPKDNK